MLKNALLTDCPAGVIVFVDMLMVSLAAKVYNHVALKFAEDATGVIDALAVFDPLTFRRAFL